jgi:hypothetical protein
MVVFRKRRRKFITPFILGLWLFAIFVSVAHACGLDEDLEHAGLNVTANVSGHDGSDDGGSPSCDKFCADDFPLLAKLKVVQDPPTGQALLVPTLVGESFQTAAAAPVPSLLPSLDPPPGIAVNIRFVRLAL